MALPTLRTLGFIIGIFVITLAVAMLVPMATLLYYGRANELHPFIWSAIITFTCGLGLVIPGRPE